MWQSRMLGDFMMELIFFSQSFFKKHLALVTPVHEAGSFSQTFVFMSNQNGWCPSLTRGCSLSTSDTNLWGGRRPVPGPLG